MDWGGYELEVPGTPPACAADPYPEPDCCATCERTVEVGDLLVCTGRLGVLLEARAVVPGMPGEAAAVAAAVRDAEVPEVGWCRMWGEAEL